MIEMRKAILIVHNNVCNAAGTRGYHLTKRSDNFANLVGPLQGSSFPVMAIESIHPLQRQSLNSAPRLLIWPCELIDQQHS